MNDNVIKFKKPNKPKPPRQINPALRKLIVVLTIVVLFAIAWAYFNYDGPFRIVTDDNVRALDPAVLSSLGLGGTENCDTSGSPN